MKRCQTTKYRKQRKKELANRKAKRQRLVVQQVEQIILAGNAAPTYPVRRAFQDI